jgi:hypothetical protein
MSNRHLHIRTPPTPAALDTKLQNLLQLLLLLARQAGWELDLDAHNEVTPLTGLLTLRHTQVGVSLRPCRPCWSAAAYAELLAIDGLYGPSPAG